MYVAKDLGLFEKCGLNAELRDDRCCACDSGASLSIRRAHIVMLLRQPGEGRVKSVRGEKILTGRASCDEHSEWIFEGGRMDLQLQGKKAIVTGGSRGMGKAIARHLAREGCDVAIGARTEGPLREAATEIARETEREIVPLVVDVLNAESIKGFVQAAADAFGGVHILANCAARVGGTIPDNMDEISDEQIVKDFE